MSEKPILEGERKVTKRAPGYVVYVAYRLETNFSISHSSKLSILGAAGPSSAAHNHHIYPRSGPLSAISENSSPTRYQGTAAAKARFGDLDNQDTARSSHSSPLRAGQPSFGGGNLGTGAYDIVDLDEDDFGLPFGSGGEAGLGRSNALDPLDGFGSTSGGFGGERDDEDDDERMLEELEDKQLMARITNLEGKHFKLTEQVKKLEHGRVWIENRLTAVEHKEQNHEGQRVSTSGTSVRGGTSS